MEEWDGHKELELHLAGKPFHSKSLTALNIVSEGGRETRLASTTMFPSGRDS